MFVPKSNFDAMPLDELWSLHEAISAVLFERMQDQKRRLEDRLSRLNPGAHSFEPLTTRVPTKIPKGPAEISQSRNKRNLVGSRKTAEMAERRDGGWPKPG
jgi:hypothetical protein